MRIIAATVSVFSLFQSFVFMFDKTEKCRSYSGDEWERKYNCNINSKRFSNIGFPALFSTNRKFFQNISGSKMSLCLFSRESVLDSNSKHCTSRMSLFPSIFPSAFANQFRNQTICGTSALTDPLKATAGSMHSRFLSFIFAFVLLGDLPAELYIIRPAVFSGFWKLQQNSTVTNDTECLDRGSVRSGEELKFGVSGPPARVSKISHVQPFLTHWTSQSTSIAR